MKHRRSRSRFTAWTGVAAALCSAVVLSLVACEDPRPQAASAPGSSGVPTATLTQCSAGNPNDGCPCETPGEEVECGQVVRRSGSYVACSEGKRTCSSDRTWGSCIGDGIATKTVSAMGAHFAGLAASASTCSTNPCDPYCKEFLDKVPGVPVVDGGGIKELDGGLGLVSTTSDAGASTCTGLTPMANKSIVITKLSPMVSTPATVTFSTSLQPSGCAATSPLWGVDRFDLGAISSGGVYTHVVPIPAVVNVTAYVGTFTATATATVTVNVVDTSAAPTGYTDANFPAAGPYPSAEAVPTGLYPYANTVFPQALRAPLLMWRRAGASAAKAVKVSLVFPSLAAPKFQWSAIISEPATPSYQIPQAAWDAFGQTAAGATGNIVIQRIDSANKLQNVVLIPIEFATANLRGRIYYSEYDTAGQGDVKIVIPSGTTAATTAQVPVYAGGNCGVCHSMSADSSKFITSYEVASPRGPALNPFGMANVLSSGALQALGAGPGGAGDSRGLAYAALTKTGSYALLADNWWGNVKNGTAAATAGGAGAEYKVFSLPSAAGTATNVSDTGFGGAGNVWGIDNAQMYTPTFSPDNTRLMYVDADTAMGAAARQGISFWVFNEAGKRFSSRTRFVRTTAAGNPANQYVRWPMWELDSQSVIFQTNAMGANDDGFNWYGGMLPSGCCGRIRVRSRFWSVNAGGPGGTPAPSTPVSLEKINVGLGNPSSAGTGADDTNRSYQPTMLGTVVGGYRWAVFTSNRAYGNLLNTGTGALSTMTNKLWVAAIDNVASAASDRSNPPFMLPNQNLGSTFINERGFWALDACKPPDVASSECVANDECCGWPATTACAVDTPLSSPTTRHCKTTSFASCRNLGQSCTSSAQCCGAPSDQCVSGTCQSPPPVVAYNSSATFTRDYKADCGTSQHIAWRFFDWKTLFPPSAGSSITFTARTAKTVAGLATATPVTLGTQTSTNTSFIGADVSAALAAAMPKQTSQEYLRISMTFTPTTDKTGTPLLTEWRQTKDCPDTE